MKNNKRKLSLGKETLKLVTGAGLTLTVKPPSTACPILATQAVGCSMFTCLRPDGYPNTCAPWGCQSDLPTC